MGALDGKVVFITGVARGQGKSHALRAAQEGADIVGVDLCQDIPSNGYALSRPEDLEETAREIKAFGREAILQEADVRDRQALKAAIDHGVAQLGHLDGVVANAGICPLQNDDPQAFVDAVDVCFGGVTNTVTTSLPHLREGASIVATGSIASMITHESTGVGGIGAGGTGYMWAKRTVASYIHDLALVLGPQRIRANAVHPTNVNTKMFHSDPMYRVFRPDLEAPTRDEVETSAESIHAMPLGWVEPGDVSTMVIFLLSDESRLITGTQMRVDGGAYVKIRPQVPYF